MTKKRKASKRSRWTKRQIRLTSVIIELAGIVIMCVGAGMELAMKADVWWFVSSCGCVAMTCGAVIWAKVRL